MNFFFFFTLVGLLFGFYDEIILCRLFNAKYILYK